MATSNQIRALIESHLERDDTRFMATAMQVAAHAARQGHRRVAEEIRELIDDAKTARLPTLPVPITTPKGDLAALLSVSYPETRLSQMVLPADTATRFQKILREQKNREKLLSHGLYPRNKLLLVGPPGSGKTMTASALAGELRLPLYTVQLHGLITKFMGETAAKLRLVFDSLRAHRGVYLFDEFDALGSQRSNTNDVGEIRRVLNSFLQFLEQDDSASLVIAATNHPEVLDRALFRRFDEVIAFDTSSPKLIRQLIENKLAAFDITELEFTDIVVASEGLSNADIARASESAAISAVLDDSIQVKTSDFLDALRERRNRVYT